MSVTPNLGTPGSVNHTKHLLGSPPPESPSSGPGSGEMAPVLSGQHRVFQETPPVPGTPILPGSVWECPRGPLSPLIQRGGDGSSVPPMEGWPWLESVATRRRGGGGGVSSWHLTIYNYVFISEVARVTHASITGSGEEPVLTVMFIEFCVSRAPGAVGVSVNRPRMRK